MTAPAPGGERLCAEECWRMTVRALEGCDGFEIVTARPPPLLLFSLPLTLLY